MYADPDGYHPLPISSPSLLRFVSFLCSAEAGPLEKVDCAVVGSGIRWVTGVFVTLSLSEGGVVALFCSTFRTRVRFLECSPFVDPVQ